jgi:hypothetical protein
MRKLVSLTLVVAVLVPSFGALAAAPGTGLSQDEVQNYATQQQAAQAQGLLEQQGGDTGGNALQTVGVVFIILICLSAIAVAASAP